LLIGIGLRLPHKPVQDFLTSGEPEMGVLALLDLGAFGRQHSKVEDEDVVGGTRLHLQVGVITRYSWNCQSELVVIGGYRWFDC
jgi:hypothetical protein